MILVTSWNEVYTVYKIATRLVKFKFRSMMGVLVVNLGCELGIWKAIKDGRQVWQLPTARWLIGIRVASCKMVDRYSIMVASCKMVSRYDSCQKQEGRQV
jgi:hypothetical protein